MELPFDLDNGAASTAAIGLIVLQSDATLESELRSVIDIDGVALYHARIPSAPEVNADTLKQMEFDLPEAAALLRVGLPMNVVAYGCTSGATLIGPDYVDRIIRDVHPDARTTNPISAAIAACNALGVKRLGFITPYVAKVSAAMRSLLESHGFEISAFGSFCQGEEAVVARITEQSLYDAICSVGRDANVDAIFASCTNLRSFNIIEKAEEAIGKPVLTSNQVLAWHMLSLAGISKVPNGPGQLFNCTSLISAD